MNEWMKNFISEYTWLFITSVIFLLFKNTIQSSVDGIMVFFGRDFDDDDIVDVDGAPARIVRVSLWKTTFYIYDVSSDGIVTGGNKLVVQNSQLKNMKISKRLPMLDVKNYNTNKGEKK